MKELLEFLKKVSEDGSGVKLVAPNGAIILDAMQAKELYSKAAVTNADPHPSGK